MKHITLKIPDNKYSFFMELIKNLGIEKVKEEPLNAEEKKVLNSIEKGLREVKLIEEGKLKGTPLKDFLNEL